LVHFRPSTSLASRCCSLLPNGSRCCATPGVSPVLARAVRLQSFSVEEAATTIQATFTTIVIVLPTVATAAFSILAAFAAAAAVVAAVVSAAAFKRLRTLIRSICRQLEAGS